MSMQIEAVSFQHEFRIRDVDSAYEFLCETMRTLVDRNVPKVMVKEFGSKPKWWTPQLQRLKNHRDKLYKRKNQDAKSMNCYEAALSEFSELCSRLHDSNS